MNKKEKEILKQVIEHPDGLLSPSTLINGIAHEDKRSIENLVAIGFLDEVPRERRGFNGNYTINFYRVTEKGLIFFEPWHIKIWSNIRGDIRTIIISAITASITILIAIILNKILLK